MSELVTQQQPDETPREAVIAADLEAGLRRDDGPSLDEQIRMRAYELYRQRGGGSGDGMNDWLQAEAELRGQSGATTGTR